MAIEPVEYKHKRTGTRYNSDKKCYVGYRIDVWVNGKRYRNKRFPTRQEAEKYIETLKLKNTYQKQGLKFQRKASDILLKDLIAKRLDELSGVRKGFEGRVLNYFLDIAGLRARVTDITYQHLKAFNKQRAKDTARGGNRTVKDETIDREMTIIASLLHSAGDYYDELENYVPPRIPRLQLADTRRERVIADSEQARIIKHLSRPRETGEREKKYLERKNLALEFEFAILTSSRRKEVIKLKWSDYSPEQDSLKITRWKTLKSKSQSVTLLTPIPKRVREILRLRRERSKTEYIFSEDGRVIYTYTLRLKEACAALDIPYGRFTDGGIIFHDTRHNFVTNMLEENIDLETVRDLAGLSRDMVMRYAHTSGDKKRNAIERLDGETRRGKLEKMFERIVSGEMDFDEFYTRISSKNFDL